MGCGNSGGRATIRIHLKRVYDAPGADDGARVLVDRLWPRGLSKEKAKLRLWAKDVAPSNALRKWYHHDMSQFAEFRRRYLSEIEGAGSPLDELRSLVRDGPVTLLTASRELEVSHAAVLRDVLTKRPR